MALPFATSRKANTTLETKHHYSEVINKARLIISQTDELIIMKIKMRCSYVSNRLRYVKTIHIHTNGKDIQTHLPLTVNITPRN
jgi:hypothetical protein